MSEACFRVISCDDYLDLIKMYGSSRCLDYRLASVAQQDEVGVGALWNVEALRCDCSDVGDGRVLGSGWLSGWGVQVVQEVSANYVELADKASAPPPHARPALPSAAPRFSLCTPRRRLYHADSG